MKKNKRLFILLTLYFSISQIDAQTPLSFEESLHLLNQGNQSLKIADKSIEIAKAERDKLNAFWYPSLQSTGAFVHMSEKIEVKQPLSQFTDPAKDFVHSIIPDDQVISSILDQIGANTLVFPLTPRNLLLIYQPSGCSFPVVNVFVPPISEERWSTWHEKVGHRYRLTSKTCWLKVIMGFGWHNK